MPLLLLSFGPHNRKEKAMCANLGDEEGEFTERDARYLKRSMIVIFSILGLLLGILLLTPVYAPNTHTGSQRVAPDHTIGLPTDQPGPPN